MTKNTHKRAAHTLGIQGEQLVADWYQAAGYEILERNWRCFEGEIDIIARKGRTIAVCEVKARATDRFMDPALAVGPAKQARVRTAAFRWLETNRCQGRARFDVALVINGQIQMMPGVF